MHIMALRLIIKMGIDLVLITANDFVYHELSFVRLIDHGY